MEAAGSYHRRASLRHNHSVPLGCIWTQHIHSSQLLSNLWVQIELHAWLESFKISAVSPRPSPPSTILLIPSTSLANRQAHYRSVYTNVYGVALPAKSAALLNTFFLTTGKNGTFDPNAYYNYDSANGSCDGGPTPWICILFLALFGITTGTSTSSNHVVHAHLLHVLTQCFFL